MADVQGREERAQNYKKKTAFKNNKIWAPHAASEPLMALYHIFQARLKKVFSIFLTPVGHCSRVKFVEYNSNF